MSNQTIFLPVAEAAGQLGVTAARVYQLAAAGQLPIVKRGRRTLIPRLAFERYIEQLNQQALRSLTHYEQGEASVSDASLPSQDFP